MAVLLIFVFLAFGAEPLTAARALGFVMPFFGGMLNGIFSLVATQTGGHTRTRVNGRCSGREIVAFL